MTQDMRKIMMVALVVLAGCGTSASNSSTSSSSDGGGEASNTVPTISAALKLATETSAASSLNKRNVGQAPAAGLLSLKYYITSITICENMTTTGTAYNNPTGCLELYTGNRSDSRYTYTIGQDYAPFAAVARQSDDGFVDLIDDTARATLNASKTLTADNVRSYNYGYINWYLPVKIKAQVDMGSGVVFRSKDGTTATTDVNQGPITTSSGNFSQVTSAEEAVVVLGNGGSWFKFQNPFVVAQTDIDNNTQFALDLTLNPEGLIKGYTAGLGGCGGCILRDAIGNQLLVPMIDLTPIPHKSSQSVVKETYVASVNSGNDHFDIRIELYSVQGDATRTIYGVDTATLVNASTTTAVSPFPKVAFITTASDGTLELQDYRGATGPLLTSLQRLTAVNSTTPATLHCSAAAAGGFAVDGCNSGTKAVTFTLQSITTLQ